jgi:hypothetical protein
VRLLQLLTVSLRGARVWIEQRIAHVYRRQQHLRADAREQFLRLHVARVDRRRLRLHLTEPPRELIAREQPQPERQSEPKEQGGSDRQPAERFASAHPQMLPRLPPVRAGR